MLPYLQKCRPKKGLHSLNHSLWPHGEDAGAWRSLHAFSTHTPLRQPRLRPCRKKLSLPNINYMTSSNSSLLFKTEDLDWKVEGHAIWYIHLSENKELSGTACSHGIMLNTHQAVQRCFSYNFISYISFQRLFQKMVIGRHASPIHLIAIFSQPPEKGR